MKFTTISHSSRIMLAKELLCCARIVLDENQDYAWQFSKRHVLQEGR